MLIIKSYCGLTWYIVHQEFVNSCEESLYEHEEIPISRLMGGDGCDKVQALLQKYQVPFEPLTMVISAETDLS